MATKTINWEIGGGTFTVTYGGSGDGTIVVTSDANTLHEARSQSLTVKTTKGGTVTKTITVAQAMKPYIDLTNAVVSAANQTYNGSALTPMPTVTLNGETIPSTGYDVTYSNNTNAGTASITITGKDDYTGTTTGTFTINKANPVYTAPIARTGLTYNGSAQYLTTAGSTNHGTIWYSANGSSWSTTQVYQTNAGTYTSYWKLVGDANHNDVASTSITTSIAQATGTVQFGSSAISLGYDGGSTGTVYVRAAASCGWAKTADKSVSGYNVYKSVSNYYQGTSYAVMKLTFVNSTGAAINTSFKVGPAMESTYDYTYITQWDASDVTSYGEPTNPLYSGKSKTDTWTDVAVTIPTGTHTIQFVYRKDTSVTNSPDCGYVAIPYDVSFASVAKNMPKYLGSGSFTWSSSNSSVATVNSSGQVTVVGTGTATISVSMAADSNATGASSSYTLTIKTIVPIGNVSNFSYIGAVSTKTLSPGTYKFQCWGAQGGSNAANSTYSITAQAGGKGGYSEGVLTLTEEKTLYIFVGGQGSSSGNGGWNGGGGGSGSSSYNTGDTNGVSRIGCGGGATDIALVTSNMDYYSYRTNRSSESLLSRIIVAGGGSGGAMCYRGIISTVTDYSVSGSRLTCKSTDSVSGKKVTLTGGASVASPLLTLTPTHEEVEEARLAQVGSVGGGTSGGGYSSTYQGKQNAAGYGGGFGYGANQEYTNYRYCSACGGGGWYGGGGGLRSDSSMTYCEYSGGGSGWVNISASASNRPSGYTGLELDSGTTYDGSKSFPNTTETGNETGHSGDGYAKITRIS